MWRLPRKTIAGKERQYILVGREQEHFRIWHDRILAPRPQGAEPQVAIKARGVGGIDACAALQFRWLVLKRILPAGLAVCGALEPKVEASGGRSRAAAGNIGNAERLKCDNRRSR